MNSSSEEEKHQKCYCRMDCLITGNCGACKDAIKCWEMSFDEVKEE